MSTKIVEQTITVRTDPGDFTATIERYKSNGWTLEAEADGQAVLSHPGITGAKVHLFDQEARA